MSRAFLKVILKWKINLKFLLSHYFVVPQKVLLLVVLVRSFLTLNARRISESYIEMKN